MSKIEEQVITKLRDRAGGITVLQINAVLWKKN